MNSRLSLWDQKSKVVFVALSYARTRLRNRRRCPSVRPSVCLSVCHKPIPCNGRQPEYHAVFTAW